MNSRPLSPPSTTPPARCPTEQALDVIASKWTVHIIYQLDDVRALRFSELKRALGAITHKELTKQLRRLEQHGLVTRQVFAQVPPRVEYSLTPLGRTLVAPLKGLAEWARQHGPAVEACRTSQEARPAPLDDGTARVAVA